MQKRKSEQTSAELATSPINHITNGWSRNAAVKLIVEIKKIAMGLSFIHEGRPNLQEKPPSSQKGNIQH